MAKNSTVAWAEVGTTLKPLPAAAFAKEDELEERVFSTPSLVEPDLIILARQLAIDAGFVDILGLDVSNRLVVIELKRNQTDRATFAQVVDYAACMREMSYDELVDAVDQSRSAWKLSQTLAEILAERGVAHAEAERWWDDQELRLVVVGRGEDESLRRIVRYVAERYSMPLNGVFIDLFQHEAVRVYVRSAVIEDEDALVGGKGRGRHGVQLKDVFDIAVALGTDGPCTTIIEQWSKCTGNDTTSGEREKVPGHDDALFVRLRGRENKKKGIIKLYPRDFKDPASKTAWAKVDVEALADDLGLLSDKLRDVLANDHGLAEGDYIAIPDVIGAQKLAEFLSISYASPKGEGSS